MFYFIRFYPTRQIILRWANKSSKKGDKRKKTAPQNKSLYFYFLSQISLEIQKKKLFKLEKNEGGKQRKKQKAVKKVKMKKMFLIQYIWEMKKKIKRKFPLATWIN